MTRISRSNGTNRTNGSGRPALHGAFTALVTPFLDDGALGAEGERGGRGEPVARVELERWRGVTHGV